MKLSIHTICIFIILFYILAQTQAPAQAEKVSYDQNLWKQVSYRKLTPNQVEYKADAMLVSVDSSASPIVYKLPQGQSVKKIKYKIEVDGLDLAAISSHKKLKEDSCFRVGLVLEGKQKLNFFQRKVAANWILELFKLAPEGKGLSHIEFYNIGWLKSQNGEKRTHPASDLIKENWMTSVEDVLSPATSPKGVEMPKGKLAPRSGVKPGSKATSKAIESPKTTSIATSNVQPSSIVTLVGEFQVDPAVSEKTTQALWLSIDGDDMKIKYKVKILELSIEG